MFAAMSLVVEGRAEGKAEEIVDGTVVMVVTAATSTFVGVTLPFRASKEREVETQLLISSWGL